MSLALFAEMQALKARMKEMESRIADLEKIAIKSEEQRARPVLGLPKKELAHG